MVHKSISLMFVTTVLQTIYIIIKSQTRKSIVLTLVKEIYMFEKKVVWHHS